MSRNSFTRNASVARSYVASQRLKGRFQANIQPIAVTLSSLFMFLGVLLMYTRVHLELTEEVLFKLLAAWPIALVAAPIAILIEGMVLVVSSSIREVKIKIEQEVKMISRLKKGFTEEEKQKKIKQIKRQKAAPYALLFLFCGFSLVGSEMFWHSITQQASLFFQCIGYVMGAVISISLLYSELHVDLIERGIDRSISSSALVFKGLEFDAKGQILESLSKARQTHLSSSEFEQTMREAALSGLYGVLSETISNIGSSVSAEQLQRMVNARMEERSIASAIVEGGLVDDEEQTQIVKIGPQSRKTYHSKKAALVHDLVKKYSRQEVLNNVEKYANEIGVSPNTIRKYA